MSNKTDKPRNTTIVSDWLSANEGRHEVHAIAGACELSRAVTGKALKQLAVDGTVTSADTDGMTLWSLTIAAWDNDADSSNPADSTEETTLMASMPTETEGTDEAEQEQPAQIKEADQITSATQVEPDPETPVTETPAPVIPDTTILLVATMLQLATIPTTYLDLASKCGLSSRKEAVLAALWALRSTGVVVCDKEFRPDGGLWSATVTDLVTVAATVQMTDAPIAVECPMCGSQKPIPREGQTKPGFRKNGSAMLVKDELKDQITAWVSQNQGELTTPGQLMRDLKAEHPERYTESNGAVKNVLDKMCLAGTVEKIEGAAIHTYRCL